MAISTYLANALLEHQVGKTAFTAPTAYAALSSTTPNVNGTNVTEPTAGNYSRVTTSAASWGSAAAGAITNAAALTFPVASADWVSGASLTHVALYDAATGGNLLGFAAVSVAKSCLAGDQITIPVSNLNITLS
jgi:hypothetical protein